ncbi:hypothetical protein ASG88_03690 [Nocardioides sp. Soil777]|uniref:sucrase ferredoxin n=1 Tax=Nocardioides sp. Soil777 TaxID=1736409 RepID=UPI0007028E3F|nr:sucrase ferredoxin [Nocardioides sp. Soil777]KRF02497.1 hypothetical protein ASG88_03690 [Nocardioides sp. Soil777]
MTDFRCSVASRDDGEPIAGTAPTDTAFLLVEHAGSWGRKAVAESRLPEAVRDHLGALTGVRVQLIRRHGGESGPGVRVFHARATLGGFDVRTEVLPDAESLLDLHLDDDLGGGPDWTAYDAPLWLVCTNGRRDRCCAEIGRPITAALAGRWPEATWETTHLGGHRFAGTLLALPSGHTLGRLDVASAVEACAILEKGSVPVEASRGRAGLTPAEQVRELHVLAGGDPDVDVVEVPSQPRRASCADLVEKPTTRWEVRAR